ncbi:Aldehyde dehydrogenase [Cordyceps fumosorosea ARSEF 2679]|uniref:Aldehyde dehydrogenase n=1 Tax=Cordyceps fumosorosea (strain ARSEF 2679) TaxID=1081104 RepID=A0A168CL56_CORFA|nr:Aldehyde dehydrogenase [Cordyceps fumosorosea ARSEF 2679]OAA71511.1 Aldehyde dehydrogenase [Cordyceps fumosorosea ARSEF 2679]
MASTTTIPLVIGGKDVVTPATFDVVNPSTGAVLHASSSASVPEALAAVDAAAAAFPSWRATHPDHRRAILLRAVDALAARADALKASMRAETGSDAAWADLNVAMAREQIVHAASHLVNIEARMPVVADPGREAVVIKEPYGVGSELSPETLRQVCAVLWEAGLPPGVLNFITSAPSSAAAVTAAVVAHRAVRKVNFTGSTAVGRIIGRLAGENLKPVLLELGGKAPSIVLADADLKLAARHCALGAFLHAGQICMSTERILVHESVRDAFAEALVAATASLYGTDGGEAPVLVAQAAVAKNRALVADAVAKGATVLYGDVDAAEASATRMRPIVVADVRPDMDVYKTESFGPTVSLISFATDDEAVEVANDTEYGLAAAVFSRDLRRALAVARRIETGAVHVNSMTPHDEPALPHGGAKDSGFGRFGGGFDEWTRTKTITYDSLV